MLLEPSPVIGTGEWEDVQCYNFKNLDSEGMLAGDIVLVREGATPIALCKIIDDRAFKDLFLEEKHLNIWYRLVEVLDFFEGNETFPQPQGTLQRLKSPITDSFKFISTWHKKIMYKKEMESYIDILEYKKQIILQGPPGTGKTKLAREIAYELINNEKVNRPIFITNQDIIRIFKDVNEVSSLAGKVVYKVIDVDKQLQAITLEKSTGSQDKTEFSEIAKFYKDEYFKNSFDDNDSRRAAALANYVYQNIINQVELENTDQFRIIQFHPSYTYEDFVRGIVANPNEDGTGITYKPENKILGELAALARENFEDSQKPSATLNSEEWVRDQIKSFQVYLEEKLLKDEKIWLTKDVAYITRVTNETIRYKGDNWKIDGGIPYSDLEKMFLANINTLSEIRELEALSLSAKSNTTYWQKLLMLFIGYLKKKEAKLPTTNFSTKVKLKKYVIIIDEINRANLSSVLGELIYGLEYRGKNVESIYKDEKGNPKLTLPTNLYIIGTMNTADRSVGHIDYAVRRRFAFVEVLPKILTSNSEIIFFQDLFKKVTSLFTTDNYKSRSEFLSYEFEPRDVALGHSYFIQTVDKDGKKVPHDMNIRLEYEIKPLLYEYLKDGVLKPDSIFEIEKLTIQN